MRRVEAGLRLVHDAVGGGGPGAVELAFERAEAVHELRVAAHAEAAQEFGSGIDDGRRILLLDGIEARDDLFAPGVARREARKIGDEVACDLRDAVEVVLEPGERAAASGRDSGFLKVMVVRGRPVGVTLVGEDAGEQIAFWALALAARLKMSAIAGTVLPYPTVAELSKRAAGAYFSPRLFGNLWVKRVVRAVQRFVP